MADQKIDNLLNLAMEAASEERIKSKNLNVGYDLPMAVLRPLGLTRAQVFMNATNLFSISAMNEFMDPEQKYYDSFPLMRSFTFGLNFSF